MRELYLPQGSIRALIAFPLIGGFIIFVFYGGEAFQDIYKNMGATESKPEEIADRVADMI